MRISIASPIPDMGSMPGPSRPGWGPAGSYDFQFEVAAGQVGITVLPRVNGLRFTIKWQDGTEQAITSAQTNLQSPTTQAGIISINNEKLDTTWCDDFKIASGQNLVTKVLSWGQNPWNNMNNAFSGCTSLSDISTTKFIADSSADIIKMFNGCTSLLEADIRNWDLTAGVSFYGGSPFRDLVNLQKLDMTGLNIKLISRSDYAFAGIGTAVTDGCEFLMSGLNMSTSTATTTPYFFDYSRIKPTSDLSNWVFNPNGFSGTGMFRGIQLTGTNSILNCSGWSTYSGSKFPSFTGGNSGAGNTGAKINFTNLNVSNINDFSTSFQSADFSGIIGLSTWGATPGNVSMYRAFYVAEYFKFSNSDNFSNAFIASLSPSGTGFNQVFQLCGSSISSNFGEAPNLNNIDLSNISSLSSTFESARFYDVPDLSTATFPSTGVSCFKTFKSLRTESSNTHVDFSNVSIKISNAREMFAVSYVDSITFGNNVDFSLCTDVYRKLYQVNFPNTVNITYPTAESGLSWAALTQPLQWFTSTTGPTTGPLTTCQVDNLIRSFHNTALNSGLTVDFGLSKITESPSVVSTLVTELENTGGWNITPNTLDGTIPFEYPNFVEAGVATAPTNNTGGAFTGTFSSSDPTNIPVNSETGVINTTNTGNATIRYTLSDGCYTEQAIQLVSAEFSYSASAYCQDAADPTPTVTGTSGGTFSAALKFFPFQMQFDTSDGKTITIPGTIGSSFTVDWGDGNTTTETGGDISHTYASGRATSIVSIGAQGDTGAFGGLRFNNGGSKTDLLEIKQWGSIEFINLLLGFYGCSNMQITATDSPNLLLSGTGSSTSLQQIFFNCTALTGNSYMNNWDVSNVTNMFYAFANTAFNADISNWDVSSVTSFSRCFQGCSNFNQDISSWDMSSVTDASFMFYNATSFNQPIGSWNLTSATNLYQMLLGASSFNQNIGGWSLRTASTPSMGYLLFGTTSMSNANSTDSVVGWANYVYNNTAPFNVSLTNSNINAKFDGARSGLPNFTTAADAKTYLTTTAGWSIN